MKNTTWGKKPHVPSLDYFFSYELKSFVIDKSEFASNYGNTQ